MNDPILAKPAMPALSRVGIASQPIQFSKQWWKNKDVTIPWCADFCSPFFKEHPEWANSQSFQDSHGIVFYNRADGSIHPVGIVGIEDGKSFIFQYHPVYLADDSLPAIAQSLPKSSETFVKAGRLPSFFDNLLSEGTLGKLQGFALGQLEEKIDGDREDFLDRYHRMMMFGRDCPGAVWCTYVKIDPALAKQNHNILYNESIKSRATIAGVQPKLLVRAHGEIFRPTRYWETSSHIAKLPSAGLPYLPEYEYMSFVATKAVLPNDEVPEVLLTKLLLKGGEYCEVLAIKRFDRTGGDGRLQFEELNQIMRYHNKDRYKGSYHSAADCIRERMGEAGVKQFYARLASQFLMGNTDSHLKNFAMFCSENGQWSMTPNYDLAPTANYTIGGKKQDMLALKIQPLLNPEIESYDYDLKRYGASSYQLPQLNAKILILLGRSMGLGLTDIKNILIAIRDNVDKAEAAVRADPSPQLNVSIRLPHKHPVALRNDFCERLRRRQGQLFSGLERF